MPGVSISEYSPPSNALISNYNSANKGTDRVKQVKIIGERVFQKYLCSAKILHSIYRVIKESINFIYSIILHSLIHCCVQQKACLEISHSKKENFLENIKSVA